MNNIRDIITLIEDKSSDKLEQIDLPYSRTALSPVLSKSNIDNHYGKLYKGYVDRFNKKEGDRSFNEAGAYLHKVYFSQFKAPRNGNVPTGASLALINKHFGNFKDFKEDMLEEAMKLQGSNWIYLSRSGKIKTIKNHQIKTDIALLIDWWEHAWTDYGSDKKKYYNNIWRIINWEVINRRIYSGRI